MVVVDPKFGMEKILIFDLFIWIQNTNSWSVPVCKSETDPSNAVQY
jgi:hypothetical protein